jgi:hypothetical protein
MDINLVLSVISIAMGSFSIGLAIGKYFGG